MDDGRSQLKHQDQPSKPENMKQLLGNFQANGLERT